MKTLSNHILESFNESATDIMTKLAIEAVVKKSIQTYHVVDSEWYSYTLPGSDREFKVTISAVEAMINDHSATLTHNTETIDYSKGQNFK